MEMQALLILLIQSHRNSKEALSYPCGKMVDFIAQTPTSAAKLQVGDNSKVRMH